VSADTVSRLNAALEGRYTVQHEIGEGGMATVYLADDIKHERKVALKVLKPELAAVVGAERFLAEIKTTANLQHPHILPLFDSGEADGFLFYVMPFVDGETLRGRIDREKQLAVKDALAITQKVASALDYAHGHGVVHRDIKPANVLLSEQGEPLVADFGIALAVAQAGGGRMTETGLSLGTPHYMSPEQATGDRDVDPRSDVYALGCVLYEMLAGEPPFSASTAQAVLVKVLTADAPPVTEARRTVPPHVSATIAQALEKLPADRFASAADFAAALQDEGFTYQARLARTGPAAGSAATTPSPAAAASSPTVTDATWLKDHRTVAMLFVGMIMAVVAGWGWIRPPAAVERGFPTRSFVDIGDIQLGPADKIIVSPDGDRFAVAGTVDGERAMYLRGADDERFRLVPETEGAREPSFSPDGLWLAYSSGRALLRVSVSGGAPRPLVPAGDLRPRDAHWGDAGSIVFSGPTGMYLVPETGGEVVALRTTGFFSPSLLPGGRAIIGGLAGDVVLLDLETDSVRTLVADAYQPELSETGHLLYSDDTGGLWAVAFDMTRLDVVGTAVPIFGGLSISTGFGSWFARYSLSRNGTLVYGAGGGSGTTGGRRMVVVSLDGDVVEPPLARADFGDFRWSPDGRFVAYASGGDELAQVFTYDVSLGTTPRPLTSEGVNTAPIWSPDGTRIVFASARDGSEGVDLFVKDVNEDSPPEHLLRLSGYQAPLDWPSDDEIVFLTGGPDLRVVNLSGDSAVVREYLSSEDELRDMQVSPSGDLAAYDEFEEGGATPPNVFIRSYPDIGAREMVSTATGFRPRWSPDGRTIYYWTVAGPVRILMAAHVERGPPFVVTSTDSLLSGTYNPSDWDLHPAGDRFVITENLGLEEQTDENVAPERFLVVVNWFEELRAALGEGN